MYKFWTYIRGEGVEEGEHGGWSGAGPGVEDRDAQVHPGHRELDRRGALARDGDVGDGKVRRAVQHLANHPVPVTGAHFASILQYD